MSTILLGTTSHQAELGVSVNADSTKSSLDNATVIIDTPSEDIDGNPVPLDKQLAEVRHAFALHSSTNASWVEGQDEGFTKNVSQVFGCDVGRPSDWEAPAPVAGAPPTEPQAPTIESVKFETETDPQTEGDSK